MIEAMRRLLSGVGRTLITVGVLLLLFVAYQLWGTGIRQAQAQSKLADRFTAELKAAGVVPINFDDPSITLGTVPPDTVPPDTVPPTTVAASTVPPTSTTPATKQIATTKPPAPATTIASTTMAPGPTTTTRQLAVIRKGRSKQLAPKPGRSLGVIVIRSVGIRQQLVEGAATADLKTAPGHYLNTPYPGQPGNVAIAGHRTTYGAPFLNLSAVRTGDPIFIQTLQGAFRYDVIDECKAADCKGNPWFTVSPTNRSVLVNTPDDNILTLTTCHPAYTAERRLIVRARLVGPAADSDFYEPVAPPKTAPPKPAPAKTVPPTSPSTTPVSAPAAATVAPTTAEPVTFDPPSVTEIGGDVVDTVAADRPSATDIGANVVDTSAIDAAAAADGTTEAPSLDNQRDPNGTGPVWKVGWFQGHRSTWLETLGLALICAVIWVAAWLIARKRRFGARALIYGVGFVFVFLPAVYFAFEHVARLLPDNI
jgi:sortase A